MSLLEIWNSDVNRWHASRCHALRNSGDTTDAHAKNVAQAIEILYKKREERTVASGDALPNRNGSCGDHVMANARITSPEVIRQLVDYDASTGALTWRMRSQDFFSDDARWTAEQACRRWNSRYAGRPAGCIDRQNGYVDVAPLGIKARGHVLAWVVTHGRYPIGLIDHINGVRSDNRLENLREVTPIENNRNQKMRTKNKSGAVGVWRDEARGNYQAYITVNGNRVWSRRFETFEIAAAERKKKEIELGFFPGHGRAS